MKQRILAVDDEPQMLQLLERIVTERTPYRIQVTNNSLEVPRMLEKQRFDLIISDLMMPGMDGMDILAWLREHDRDELVILITAFGSLESAAEALAQGVFDYITKPFSKEQLITAVDRAMQWQRVRRQAEDAAEMFDCRPYEKARRRFDREYVRRLAEACGGDRQAMAEAAEVDKDFIDRHMPKKPAPTEPEASS